MSGGKPTSAANRLKLDRRIRNQRMALRENWEIIETRWHWQKTRPLQSRYLAHCMKLRAEIAELTQALQSKVTAERGEHYRVVRRVRASVIQARKGQLP